MEDGKLTAKEIFDQLTFLQKQLTENPLDPLHHLDGVVSAVIDSDEGGSGSEQIADICTVFRMREQNFMQLLLLYEKMYDDLRSGTVKE